MVHAAQEQADWSIRALLANADAAWVSPSPTAPRPPQRCCLRSTGLLDEPIDRLSKQVLDADFFNDLVNPDPISILLGWLDDPDGLSAQRLDDAQWATFVQQCSADFGFDPSTDGPVTAARSLASATASGRRSGSGSRTRRSGTRASLERLRQAKPMELSFEHSDAWPQDNEAAEDQLRNLSARLRRTHRRGRAQGGGSPRRRARVAPRHSLGRSRPRTARLCG